MEKRKKKHILTRQLDETFFFLLFLCSYFDRPAWNAFTFKEFTCYYYKLVSICLAENGVLYIWISYDSIKWLAKKTTNKWTTAINGKKNLDEKKKAIFFMFFCFVLLLFSRLKWQENNINKWNKTRTIKPFSSCYYIPILVLIIILRRTSICFLCFFFAFSLYHFHLLRLTCRRNREKRKKNAHFQTLVHIVSLFELWDNNSTYFKCSAMWFYLELGMCEFAVFILRSVQFTKHNFIFYTLQFIAGCCCSFFFSIFCL